MKINAFKLTTISLSLSALAAHSVDGATLMTESVFDSIGTVRKPGSTDAIVAAVADQTPYNGTTSGAVSWSHSVSGFTQSRVGIPAITIGTGLVAVTTPAKTLADAQLASYVAMDGTSLTFGREITTEVFEKGDHLEEALNAIAGVSPLQSWSSTATVAANMLPGSVYELSVDISTGSGLPVDLLESTQIGVLGMGIMDANNTAFTKINLLDLVTLGDQHECTATFLFQTTQELSSLGFEFTASAVADVSALGGTAGNQNLISFSNLTVSPVPEPSTSLFGLSAVGMLMGSRRRSSNKR